jgi:hypothetical protein
MQRPITVMRHGLAAPRLNRQPRLGAVERLDLAFFVERQHDRVSRRIDIEPNDVGELGGKTGITRAFKAAQAVRLQPVRPLDALHRTQRASAG